MNDLKLEENLKKPFSKCVPRSSRPFFKIYLFITSHFCLFQDTIYFLDPWMILNYEPVDISIGYFVFAKIGSKKS